ncbi:MULTISPECIES: pilus assembly FimT family protein [Calditerrivibrio]|uniref:pilus assembly FimT family protein n=1 Tax=Calditerrivibrio TaxID=545865 RepID=UPI003C73F99A
MKRGLTLLELMIVLVILGIVLSVGVYSYESYSRKISVEDDVHTAYAFIMKARVASFTEKEDTYVILINQDGKALVMDNDSDTNNGFIERIDLKNRFLQNISYFKFDKNGFADFQGDIRSYEDVGAQYDCVVISWSRVAKGKYDQNQNKCVAN